jgi:hypothetical protein
MLPGSGNAPISESINEPISKPMSNLLRIQIIAVLQFLQCVDFVTAYWNENATVLLYLAIISANNL